jgi:hypothetical protein
MKISRKKVKIITLLLMIVMITAVIFIFLPTAKAEKIASRDSSYYLQYHNSSGWHDMDTPEHYIVGSNPEIVAYCLEHAQASPSSSGSTYSTSNVLTDYSSTVRKGIYTILQNGYPYYKPSNLTAKEARYATANAIRMWMSEKNQPYQYNFMDLSGYSDSQLRSYASSGTIPNHVRAKGNTASNKEVLQFSVELLIKARAQSTMVSFVSIANTSCSQSGAWFVASTTVTLTNCNSGYRLNTANLPGGSYINGYTGQNGDNLTIYIPADFSTAQRGYSISATGYDTRSTGNIVAYKAQATSIQTVVNAFLDSGTESASSSFAVYTPQYIQLNPDLVVTSLTTDKSAYNSGDTVIVYASVYNNSNRSCDGSYWVRTRSDQLGEMNWQRFGTLAAYGTANYSFSFIAPSSVSSITLDFYADAGYEIAELNEGNNQAFKSIGINRLPDLAVTGFTTDKSSYIAGETVKVTAFVTNNSDMACGAFWYNTGSDKIGDLNWQRCGGFSPSGTGNYSFSFIAPSVSSTVMLSFFADAGSEIQEINESNNKATRTISITALPDLTITSLSTDKTSYFPSDTVTVSATVKNTGSVTAPSSTIRLTPGALLVQNKTVSTLAAGASTNVTWTITLPEDDSDVQQTVVLTAAVDPANAIQESNETNNTVTKSIIINPTPKPDLQIIGANTVDWYGGKDVVVSVQVRNSKTVAVPSVTVRMKLGSIQKDEAICAPGSADNLAVFRFTVPIPSGQSQAFDISFTVDPDNSIKESNEGNNSYTKTQTVYALPLSIVADPDAISLEDAYVARGKTVPSLQLPSSSTYHTWQEYRYENGSYILKNYWARLTTTFRIQPDMRIAYPDKPRSMESGFGVQADCHTVVTTNYGRPEKLVGSQLIWVYAPESLYGTTPFENIRDVLTVKSGYAGDLDTFWQLDVNPYSVTQQPLHYTPLWFADGQYTLWAQAFYAWSPAGQINENTTDNITINGDMYDRITTVKR